MECRRENVTDERIGVKGKTADPSTPLPGFPVGLDGVGGPHAPFLKRKAHTWPCLALRGRKSGFATIRVCDFFIFRFSLRPESPQEHLPTSIAGVLRLRAMKPSVSDRSAKRSAQDDDFVVSWKRFARDDNSVCVVMIPLRRVTSSLPRLSQSNSRDICHIRNRSHIRNSARQHAHH